MMEHGQAIESLSPREREIVKRLADGEPQKAIAAALGIAVRTVEVYTQRAREKLQARTVTHLVVIWSRVVFPPSQDTDPAGKTRQTES
jgi:DNA-binding CsgD family transcriptional regulator